MKITNLSFVATRVFATAVLCAAFFASGAPLTKKFIGTGWDTLRVSPEEVLANAPLFAESGLDGINLAFSTKNASGEKLAFDTLERYKNADDVAAFWCNLNQAAAVSAEYVWLDVGSDDITGDGAGALRRWKATMRCF